MGTIKWSVKDIVGILKLRQRNDFDGNIAVSGDRGNGKSTLIAKIFYRMGGFRPQKHQVYQREHILKLLKGQKYGLCFDDEAINTGYKRNFQDKGQQELIKFLTAYRDHFNIYASAIPNFFNLDKDLRDLYFLHLHVIERGLAVVHMPIQGRLYSQDRWDSRQNGKIEDKWNKQAITNGKFKPKFNKLSTFRGYLYFKDLTELQKNIYKRIKAEKKAEAFKTTEEKNHPTEKSFTQRLYEYALQGKLTKEGLVQACLVEGKRYTVVVSCVNKLLKDNGHTKTLRDFISPEGYKSVHSNVQDQIISTIPAI